MMLSVFADAIVAILLIATISYAAVLNRRLGVLRSDRSKLEALVQALTEATRRAEVAVGSLKTTAAEATRQLDKKLGEATALKDDFAYMVDRGTTIADRLEGSVRAKRDETQGPAKADARIEPFQRMAEIARARAARAEPAPAAPEANDADPAAPRRAATPSRAERDLLRALSGLRGAAE